MAGIDIVWDQRRLNNAIDSRLRLMKSSRTAAQISNTAGYWIARNTMNFSPWVSKGTIVNELNVLIAPTRTKTGKVGKRKSFQFGNLGSSAKSSKYSDVPLAALIVSARAKPGSRYNQLTNNRWALTKNPFKGVSRAEGRAAMKGAALRMLSSRRSSIKFLLSGEVPAILALKSFAVLRRRGGEASPDMSAYKGSDQTRGYAIPASEGFTTKTTIANATGVSGINRDSYNEALWKYIGPARAMAIRVEAGQMENYVLEAMKAGDAKLKADLR